jgi:hypothetical protein
VDDGRPGLERPGGGRGCGSEEQAADVHAENMPSRALISAVELPPVDNRCPVRFRRGRSRRLLAASHLAWGDYACPNPCATPSVLASSPGWGRTTGIRRDGPPGPSRVNRDCVARGDTRRRDRRNTSWPS